MERTFADAPAPVAQDERTERGDGDTLLKRLRACETAAFNTGRGAFEGTAFQEAAVEIERLRADLERVKFQRDDGIKKLSGLLRETRAALTVELDAERQRREEAERECERLRSEQRSLHNIAILADDRASRAQQKFLAVQNAMNDAALGKNLPALPDAAADPKEPANG